MRKIARPFLVGAGLLVSLAGRAAPDVQEVADCMQRNLPRESSVQDVRFVSRDRLGQEQEIQATVTWKRFKKDRSRVLIRVHAPDDLRDSAVLMIQRASGADMFLYVPELRKTRRISSHTLRGSLFGSDFTYEDFQRLQGMALEGDTERLADAEVDGVPAMVLAHSPAPEAASAYERVVSFVDRNTCLLLRAEMWEPGERLRKVLTADRTSVLEQDGVRLPRRVVVEDLKKGSSTRLELTRVELETEIPRRAFDLSALER